MEFIKTKVRAKELGIYPEEIGTVKEMKIVDNGVNKKFESFEDIRKHIEKTGIQPNVHNCVDGKAFVVEVTTTKTIYVYTEEPEKMDAETMRTFINAVLSKLDSKLQKPENRHNIDVYVNEYFYVKLNSSTEPAVKGLEHTALVKTLIAYRNKQITYVEYCNLLNKQIVQFIRDHADLANAEIYKLSTNYTPCNAIVIKIPELCINIQIRNGDVNIKTSHDIDAIGRNVSVRKLERIWMPKVDHILYNINYALK